MDAGIPDNTELANQGFEEAMKAMGVANKPPTPVPKERTRNVFRKDSYSNRLRINFLKSQQVSQNDV